MATYDYSAHKPNIDAFDYPAKLDAFNDAVSTDMTTESNRLDSVKTKTDFITVTGNVNLTTEQSKLATVETGATADQSKADIDALGIAAATATNADNATLLDSIDSTQFLRSDTADIKTSGNLTFNDNVQLHIGNAGDMQIYHNGINSFISNTTGNLYFQYTGGNVMQCSSAGVAILYYANNTRLTTNASGISLTGRLDLQSFSESAQNITTGGAITLNTSSYTYFYQTSSASIPTFTFSNPAPATQVTTFTLEFLRGGTYAPVWPASVEWSSGTEPSWSTSTTAPDIVSFVTRNAGVTWYGFPGGFGFA